MNASRACVAVLAIVACGVSPTLAAGRCITFECEVFSIDSSGTLHPLFNFAQGLKAGENWATEMKGESTGDLNSGTLSVSITWDQSLGDPDPIVRFGIHVPPAADRPALEGAATLEKTPWDSLLGPETFTTSTGATLDLADLGHAVAVVSVTPTKCSRN